MGTKNPAVQVDVEVDTEEAENRIKRFTDTLVGHFLPTIDIVYLAEKAWDGVSRALGAVVDLAKESIAAANEQVAAETRLTAALTARHQATGNLLSDLNAYNTVMQQATGIGDDQLLTVQSQLIALGVHRDELQLVTKATIGLSEVTGKDLPAAATMMARVMEGNTKILERSGIQVSSSAEAVKVLADMSELATARMSTFGGQMGLFEQNVGELKETLGDPVVRSKGLIASFQALNDVLLGTNTIAGKVRDTLVDNDVFGKMAASLAAAVSVVPVIGLLETNILDVATALSIVGKEARQLKDDNQVLSTDRTFEQTESEFQSSSEHLKAMVDKARRKAALKEQQRQVGVLSSYFDESKWMDTAQDEKDTQAYSRNVLYGALMTTMGGEAAKQQRQLDDVRKPSKDAATKAQREIAQAQDAFEMQRAQTKIDLNRKLNRMVEEDDETLKLQRLVREQQFYDNLGQTAFSGMTGVFGSLISAGFAGKKNLDALAATAFGGLLSSLGQTLFSAGTAALAAATLGGFFPFLRAAGMGGPEGVPAALGAMAIGTGLMAVGGGLTAAGSRTSGGSLGGGGASSSSGTQPTPRTDFGAGFKAPSSNQPVINTFAVTINGGLFGGSRRAVARDIMDLWKEAQRSNPAGGT